MLVFHTLSINEASRKSFPRPKLIAPLTFQSGSLGYQLRIRSYYLPTQPQSTPSGKP